MRIDFGDFGLDHIVGMAGADSFGDFGLDHVGGHGWCRMALGILTWIMLGEMAGAKTKYFASSDPHQEMMTWNNNINT